MADDWYHNEPIPEATAFKGRRVSVEHFATSNIGLNANAQTATVGVVDDVRSDGLVLLLTDTGICTLNALRIEAL